MKPFLGTSALKDKCCKISCARSLKKTENKKLLQVYLTYQSNQCEMDASTKFSNISIRGKQKLWFKTFLVKRLYLIPTEMRCKPYFNEYAGRNRSHKTL